MTVISDLPINLLEEILSRVPLKNMGAVRLACKEWDALSKSRSFSKMHIGKLSAGESMMAVLMDYNLYLMRVVLPVNEDPFIERIGKLNKQNNISNVYHCDGLLLCVLRDFDTRVIVWNPYWGQTRSIEYSHVQAGGHALFNHALGYEDKGSYHSYKFLRFIDHYYYSPVNRFSGYEIYDFDSSLWKTLDISQFWRIRYHHHGVSLKGNTYWPASQINSPTYGTDDHIIYFDFTNESFGPLLCLPFDTRYSADVTLSCVREEKLAVLFSDVRVGKFEVWSVWITTKIEAEEVLWSKFLTVETGFYALLTNNSFFIDEEKKVAISYSKTFEIVGEAGYLKKLELVERAGGDRNYRENACSYVPSLLQIKQPASGRKVVTTQHVETYLT